jgi:hypothetical protein
MLRYAASFCFMMHDAASPRAPFQSGSRLSLRLLARGAWTVRCGWEHLFSRQDHQDGENTYGSTKHTSLVIFNFRLDRTLGNSRLALDPFAS